MMRYMPPPYNSCETAPLPLSSENYSHHRNVLRSCAVGHSPPSPGQITHATLLKSGLSYLTTALFHMYTALGPPSSAQKAFLDIPHQARSTIDWTALISCHLHHALPAQAITFFRSMLRDGVACDAVTLISVLSSAASLSSHIAGASAHLFLIKLGLIPFSARALNAAVNMYAKCGRMDEARQLFNEMSAPNVVSWVVILIGSLRWEGISQGREVFDLMPEKNDVSWTVMTASYVEAGLPREALALLSQMLFIRRRLNHVSMISLLSACSQAGDLIVGRWLHAIILKANHPPDDDDEDSHHHGLLINTTLVDMYAKCGWIDTARSVFEVMPERNVVTWNAMLSGLSMHGMCVEALNLFFLRMVKEDDVSPDDITFVSLLSACSRTGMVKQGRSLFMEMKQVYGLTPKIEHYACMVDLLGRAGKLKEAVTLIREMPVRPNEVVLGSLLASCSLHGKLKLGRKVLEEVMEMKPGSTEYHVLLSNMLRSHGHHKDAKELWREVKRSEENKKAPGMSYIEINGVVHRFRAGDKSHSRTPELYAKLDEIARRLNLAGYVPNAAAQVPHSMDEYCLEKRESKEELELALMSHSEKLAVAFGLISTKPGIQLRIFKNLRICLDCHTSMKLISRIFNKDIVVRDRNRFHRFKDGVCSCSDYW